MHACVDEWKSTTPRRRNKWVHHDVVRWSSHLLESMPAAPYALLKSGKFAGDHIVCSHSDAMKSLSMNKMWLSPLLDLSPQKIPSAYMLADVFLHADTTLEGKLLCKVDKTGQALNEGIMLRQSWSYLRGLFRNSTRSYVAEVHEMKDKLEVTGPAGEEVLGKPAASSAEDFEADTPRTKVLHTQTN